MLKSLLRRLLYPYAYRIRYPRSKILSDIGNTPRVEDPVYIGRQVEISQSVVVGRYTCVMEYSQIGANCLSIGRYCSIARGVIVGANHHPHHKLTTSGAFYSKIYGIPGVVDRKREMNLGKYTTVGNDVWIGAHAVIMGGVSVGDGAVIGAGAIVTKDVPPYAIVAGVPAKLLRFRFDEKLISDLLDSKWWTLSEELLLKYWESPNEFLASFSRGSS